MQLLHPIAPKPGFEHVRLIVFCKRWSAVAARGSFLTAYHHARECLAMVCDAPIKTVMVCDSTLSTGSTNNLERAQSAIASGAVDLAITRSLTEISRQPNRIADFVTGCQQHQVRLISFEDCFDTSDENFENALSEWLADPAPAISTFEICHEH
jgi:hypothetical protein